MSTHDLESTPDRIIEAAGYEFADKGFDQATVRDICQRAGANLAAVNYHFGDKHKLYVAAVTTAHRWILSQTPLPNRPEGTPAQELLGDFIRAFMRRIRTAAKDSWQARLMMREMTTQHSACAELVQDSIRPEFERLLGILQQLLPDSMSLKEQHLFAFSTVGQCLMYHFADPVVRCLIDEAEYEELTADRLADHITRFSLAAIERLHGTSRRAKVTAGE